MAITYLSGERIQGVGTSTLGSAGDATSNGSDLVTSGHKLGTGCLNFDGSSDYIVATSGLQNAMFNADADEDAILIAFCDADANTKMEVTTRGGRSLGMQCKVGGTQQWEVSSSTLYNAYTNWNHVVLTHNGTLAEIYINGSLATMTRASTTDNTKWWTALRSAGCDGIAIGSKAPLNNNTWNEHFDGQLDDIGIWDRALTSTEVGNLYNSGTGALCTTVPSGLKVYYNCDSATVTNNAIDEKVAITNVPVGTRYEETDTRKIFRKGEKTTEGDNTTGSTQTDNYGRMQSGKITGLPAGEIIKSVQVNCSVTASRNWRVGYYSDTSGVPNALLEDIGEVGALTTGFNTTNANGTQVVPSDGIVWVTVQVSASGASLVARSSPHNTGGYQISHTYGSMPSTFGSGGVDKGINVKITTSAWVEKGTA